MMDEHRDDSDSTPGNDDGNPMPPSAADGQDLRERCEAGRDTMTPRETADCAGSDLSELYDNEEGGGS